MSDEKDIPSTDETAPVEAPPVAPTADEIAAIVTAAIDARIPALQSGYDKQIADLQTQVRQSSMDEDEIEHEATENLQAQLAKSQAETAVLIAGQSYPEALEVFKQLDAAPDSGAQLKLISDILNKAKAPTVPPVTDPAADAATAPVPPVVDPNNPRTEQAEGLEMTADRAASILKGYGKIWPGRG